MSEVTSSDAPDDLTEPFEVRRRFALFAAVVVVSLGLAAGYGWLAYDRGDTRLAVVAGLLLIVGVWFMPSLRDVSAPLLVADLHGIRLQGRDGWVGLLWSEIDTIRVVPRQGLRGPEVQATANNTPEIYFVPLGLATNASAGRTEIELARRRDAAPY